ncbi:protocatechuate 4,5-dioxygenase subunit alpha [Streptomyces europaeiscabiei]|uniref:Protocatechuate 4,5-dioxygenase subunit alpha n=1 Tax=Streptomyces europaeiscabiei TaxID=146819 RepID=A0AAJ2UJQ3_9ACTN|nr:MULTISPECIES: protocatechuate 4,5-dioxygenase subunit alpha [Streptomyces]KFG01084.1 protocatechuate 3,4-dioxygenase [Streptomyces scabiei]MDX3128791.1 protocatechuate 4,5-dioxygenase subunit alpha [Streptomyces europaeiscabiei]
MNGITPQVPGTYVFDAAESRRARALNRLCGSLKEAENREKFQADEAAYCETYGLTVQQRDAVLRRDWNRMMELGGSIFYVFKLAMVDQRSMQYLGGVFTGMTTEEFAQALKAGGRSFG